MRKIDTTFPAYKLQQHKGYATKAHKSAVLQSGASLIHRERFLTWMKSEKNNDNLLYQRTIHQKVSTV
jgi:ribonuclease HII